MFGQINKRLLKELTDLQLAQSSRTFLDNDYLIYFDESNVNKVSAIIKGNKDSVYRHTFVRLDFDIPENYPHSPPTVTFVNHDRVRIHPNMYEDGKCCATILNTWPSDNEKWTSSMGIETVLLTFQSFLDNQPYSYEPGDRDDPSYSVYVRHQSFWTCLLRYIQYERIEQFREFIACYLFSNLESIFSELKSLHQQYPTGVYSTRCFEIERYIIDYPRVEETLSHLMNYLEFVDNSVANAAESASDGQTFQCDICFDTMGADVNGTILNNDNTVTLQCSHAFHKYCIDAHVQNNSNVCPVCRQDIEIARAPCASARYDVDDTVVNPLTKRRIKRMGRTHLALIAQGHFPQ